MVATEAILSNYTLRSFEKYFSCFQNTTRIWFWNIRIGNMFLDDVTDLAQPKLPLTEVQQFCIFRYMSSEPWGKLCYWEQRGVVKHNLLIHLLEHLLQLHGEYST